MKHHLFYLLCTVLLLSCNKEISPSGNIVSHNMPFTNFSSIELNSGLQAIFTKDTVEDIRLEANENIHPYIEAFQKGEKVVFQRKDDIQFSSTVKVNIYISTRHLTQLTLSGGSCAWANTVFPTEAIKVNLSGGSVFRADLAVERLDANLSGGSRVELRGTSHEFTIDASGGSKFESYDFVVNRLNCTMSGGSIGKCTINKSLIGSLSGGSTLHYKGGFEYIPQNVVLSGGSLVENRN
ncbi:MAG: head GIN domain-containing protein [Bacteroidales bacterium]